jgi:hypothetical protein
MWYKFCTSSNEEKFDEYYKKIKKDLLNPSAAWISPSGKIYLIPDSEPQHGLLSFKILDKSYEDLVKEGWIRYRSHWNGSANSNVQFYKNISPAQWTSLLKLHGDPREGQLFFENGDDFGEKWNELRKFIL